MISIIFFLVTWSTPRLLNLEKREPAGIWEHQEQQAQRCTYSCSWEGPEHRAVPLSRESAGVQPKRSNCRGEKRSPRKSGLPQVTSPEGCQRQDQED